jgi:8-oxo-dGTP pyrophosphatase MutT (NUDIX family)
MHVWNNGVIYLVFQNPYPMRQWFAGLVLSPVLLLFVVPLLLLLLHLVWLPSVSSFTTLSLLTRADRHPFLTTQMSALQQEDLVGLRFPPDCLAEDHYGGVTLRLDHLLSCDDNDDESIAVAMAIVDHFAELLQAQLSEWQSAGKVGIWVHLPITAAALVPILAREQFVFHMVVGSTSTLVMTRWLPLSSSGSVSRLPKGPTHQVGVGCLVYKPGDSSQILVVQEKSGPAAAYRLWKMPTGLSDAEEDIHEAAIRELFEETGLRSSFDGLMCLRQAPSPTTQTKAAATAAAVAGGDPKMANSRKAADLFFVCRLTLTEDRPPASSENNDDDDDADYWATLFRACPNEIAGIQWMKISDFIEQPLWQQSPLYQQLNKVLFFDGGGDDNEKNRFWQHSTMPIRHDMPTANTLYHPVQDNDDDDDASANAPSSAL